MSRMHDPELIDALEASTTTDVKTQFSRIVRKGRDPLGCTMQHGRWSPSKEFEVLYLAENDEGAKAEIGFRLAVQPIWPSKIVHELSRVIVEVDNVLDLSNFASLTQYNVEESNFESIDYSNCQALAAAANFMEFSGIKVPNARHRSSNLVLFGDNISIEDHCTVTSTEIVDWNEWRSKNKKIPSRE